MTLEECYHVLGGNYAEAAARFPSQHMIEKFVLKFLEDKSFAELCVAFAADDRETAFRAAHTLKGVCANLSFTRLFGAASQLTEELRRGEAEIPASAFPRMELVRVDYEATVEAIRAYQAARAE
ncbi:MAG: Hpt domain-containing protein [Faecalibacterium sp.]